MAPRLVTTEPRLSLRHRGFYYVYYNAKTARGTDCVAVIPSSLLNVVHRGFAFDDEKDLHWNEDLRASVLTVDFDGPASDHPALPPVQDSGWGDHDAATATAVSDPTALRQVAERLGVVSPPPKLDAGLEELLEQACMAFLYACKRIGVAEKPRAMEAQKIATTCLIPYLRARGVNLSEEDEKAMNY